MSISVDEARFGDAGKDAAIATKSGNLLDVNVKCFLSFLLQNSQTEDPFDKVSHFQRMRKLALSAWKNSVQPCTQRLILLPGRLSL